MITDCRDCPLRRLDLFKSMTERELAFMRRFKRGELVVDAGSLILMEGSNAPQIYTVLKGIGLRYKSMADGDRQVINVLLPGDFVGLQAGVMDEMKHSVEATTQMTLCVFAREELWRMFDHEPARAFDVTWIAALEEHFLGENLAVLGRLDGRQRVAWALARYYRRMDALGLARDGAASMPFRQQDLADMVGLSLVHTNKSLARLRERGIATWQEGMLRIIDMNRIAEMTGVAPDEPSQRPLV